MDSLKIPKGFEEIPFESIQKAMYISYITKPNIRYNNGQVKTEPKFMRGGFCSYTNFEGGFLGLTNYGKMFSVQNVNVDRWFYNPARSKREPIEPIEQIPPTPLLSSQKLEIPQAVIDEAVEKEVKKRVARGRQILKKKIEEKKQKEEEESFPVQSFTHRPPLTKEQFLKENSDFIVDYMLSRKKELNKKLTKAENEQFKKEAVEAWANEMLHRYGKIYTPKDFK